MIKLVPLALALSAAALAVPAAAGSAQMRVKYSDLDLTTDRGQQVLQQRIDAAARDLCGMNRTPVGSRLPSATSRTCFEQARTSARQTIAERTATNAVGG